MSKVLRTLSTACGALLITAAFAGPAAAKDEGEAKKNYAIDTSGTTTVVKPGTDGTLKLQIKPASGYKVSAEAPLKIALSSEQVKLSKEKLGHKDATEKEAEAPTFTVPFSASKNGKGTISADAMFFICSETICERKTEKLTVAVDVKP